MPELKIYPENNPEECKSINEFTEIQAELKKINIDIEEWQNPSEEHIEEIKNKYGFKSVDIMSMTPNSKNIPALRTKFLDEHIHSDDEVRYFIEGQGLFFIHANSKVYQILCTAGDFIAVPANTKHWFDMGERPNFKCIRFFSDEAGWVAQYTGDKVSGKFSGLISCN